jgi:hypothetical protein
MTNSKITRRKTLLLILVGASALAISFPAQAQKKKQSRNRNSDRYSATPSPISDSVVTLIATSTSTPTQEPVPESAPNPALIPGVVAYTPSQLPDIDAVELVDLEDLQPNLASEYMRIAKNTPFVHVKGETAQQIAHLWRQLPPAKEKRCHQPPFGLRFYVGNKLLVQGSVCWECNNIYAEENGENLVYGFDAQHPYSQQLFALVQLLAEQSF